MKVPSTRFTSLGEVNQLAFVPADFEGAINFWVETMGAGPFFVIENAGAEWCSVRGRDSSPQLDIALGHWGDIQIEIIRQTNDAPSPYKEWRDAGGEGMHHVCIAVDDIEKAKQLSRELGMVELLNGRGNGAEWIYVDTGGGPSTVVEIIQHSPASQGLMDMVRAASVGWDGSNPVRRLGLSEALNG